MSKPAQALRNLLFQCMATLFISLLVSNESTNKKIQKQGDQCEQRKDETDADHITATGRKINSFSCRCNSITFFLADLESRLCIYAIRAESMVFLVVWDTGSL